MGCDSVTSDLQSREDIFKFVLEKNKRNDSKYDYLVLFSGGKDSTYLAYMLKQMDRNSKICLLTINNGFESENFISFTSKVAKDLGVDHYVYEPQEGEFETLYRCIIKEKTLTDVDSNAVCLFCANYMIQLAIEFAEKNNIPVVLHGLSPTQYNLPSDIEYAGKDGPINASWFLRSLDLLEAARIKRIKKLYEDVKSLEIYKNAENKIVLDKLFHTSKKVSLLFPFNYLGYNTREIIKKIEDGLNWENILGIKNELYISTGCRMFYLFPLLEKKIPGFKIHEKHEYAKDLTKGIIDRAAFDSAVESIDNFEKSEDITADLIKRLGIQDMLE